MKTAILVMPVNDNKGGALPFFHPSLRLDLCNAFGGCTITEAEGSWIDSATGRVYHESVKQYHVAAEWTPEQESTLLLIAARYGAFAEQISVMVTLAGGDVRFIDPDKELAAYLATERAAKLAA